jgi:hypothetical protein
MAVTIKSIIFSNVMECGLVEVFLYLGRDLELPSSGAKRKPTNNICVLTFQPQNRDITFLRHIHYDREITRLQIAEDNEVHIGELLSRPTRSCCEHENRSEDPCSGDVRILSL